MGGRISGPGRRRGGWGMGKAEHVVVVGVSEKNKEWGWERRWLGFKERGYFLPVNTSPEAEREEALAGLRLLRKQRWRRWERGERGVFEEKTFWLTLLTLGLTALLLKWVMCCTWPLLMCFFMCLTLVPVCSSCCKPVWRKSLSYKKY